MVLLYSLLLYKHYSCWERNPALLLITTLKNGLLCKDQPGWHFLVLFTDWITFQPPNICSHMLACKKCPLCQALLLNDPELAWSQAFRILEGSARAAAQLEWVFGAAQPADPCLPSGSCLHHISRRQHCWVLQQLPPPPNLRISECFWQYSELLSTSEQLFTRIYAFPQSAQRSQLLGSCCWGKENACKLFSMSLSSAYHNRLLQCDAGIWVWHSANSGKG